MTINKSSVEENMKNEKTLIDINLEEANKKLKKEMDKHNVFQKIIIRCIIFVVPSIIFNLTFFYNKFARQANIPSHPSSDMTNNYLNTEISVNN